MKRVVIFGAGKIGAKSFEYISKDYEVVAFVDNDKKRWNTQKNGITILSPDEMMTINVDLIIIATIYYQEIGRQLKRLNKDNVYVFEENKNGTNEEKYELRKLELLGPSDFDFSLCPIENHYTLQSDAHSIRKKVLMIAYSFPPEAGSAVQRPLKFVKYLRNYGYEPIVLTCGRNNSITSLYDESLERDIPDGVKIIRIDDEFKFSDLDTKEKLQEVVSFLVQVSESPQAIKKIIETKQDNMKRILPDTRLFWEVKCIREIENYLDMESIDIIWSTVPSYSLHLLGYYFKNKYGKPWVADYRDLWTSEVKYAELYTWYTKEDTQLQRPLEARVVNCADAIVVAGEAWEESFEREFNICRERLFTITNGYDEDDFCNIKEKKEPNCQFTLCYNGRMQHKCRNPKLIIQIINELIDEKTICSDKVCWVINGQIAPDFIEDINNVDKYKVARINAIAAATIITYSRSWNRFF